MGQVCGGQYAGNLMCMSSAGTEINHPRRKRRSKKAERHSQKAEVAAIADSGSEAVLADVTQQKQCDVDGLTPADAIASSAAIVGGA